MRNPWEEIALADYENHMKLESVLQLQTLNEMMKQQLCMYSIHSVMIFGVAGGNGLEHINPKVINKVYGIDINSAYVQACARRFKNLAGTLTCLCIDLHDQNVELPHADMVIANLLLEYIGYECFKHCIQMVKPAYVSCIIQVNFDCEFVSDSPYQTAFQTLHQIHHQITQDELIACMREIQYDVIEQREQSLPNGKCFIQIDFMYEMNAMYDTVKEIKK